MPDTMDTGYLKDTEIGHIHISEEVVAVISGIATTEAPEVVSLVGNITNQIVSRMGINNLSKGIKVKMNSDSISVTVTVNLLYGCNIVNACKSIQERVATAIETMTGLRVAEVNVFVNDMISQKK